MLHWMVSQSIFLLAIDFYDALGAEGTGVSGELDYRTLGFSPNAIVSVIVLTSVMVISMIGAGYIPYKSGMPLAGSNSMAISSACHSTVEDQESGAGAAAAFEKLKWGVIIENAGGVGHCGFSSNHVSAPVEGQMYAGDQ